MDFRQIPYQPDIVSTQYTPVIETKNREQEYGFYLVGDQCLHFLGWIS